MKRKELWLFLAKLTGLTLVFGYIWYAGLQERYPYILQPIAEPILTSLGVREWRLMLVLEHFTNIVPYLALVLASPRILAIWKKVVTALVIGTVVIVAGHIALSAAVYHLEQAYSLSKSFYRVIVPLYLINDALPLVLWLLFFPRLPGQLLGIELFGRKKREG